MCNCTAVLTPQIPVQPYYKTELLLEYKRIRKSTVCAFRENAVRYSRILPNTCVAFSQAWCRDRQPWDESRRELQLWKIRRFLIWKLQPLLTLGLTPLPTNSEEKWTQGLMAPFSPTCKLHCENAMEWRLISGLPAMPLKYVQPATYEIFKKRTIVLDIFVLFFAFCLSPLFNLGYFVFKPTRDC